MSLSKPNRRSGLLKVFGFSDFVVLNGRARHSGRLPNAIRGGD